MTEVLCSCCKEVLLTNCIVNPKLKQQQQVYIFAQPPPVATVTMALCSICCSNKPKLVVFLCDHCDIVPKGQINLLKQSMIYESKDDESALKTFINNKSATMIRDQTNFFNKIQKNMANGADLVSESTNRIKKKLEKALIEIIESEVPIIGQVIRASLSNTQMKMKIAEQKKEIFKKQLNQSKIQPCKVENEEAGDKGSHRQETQEKVFSLECQNELVRVLDAELSKLKAKAESLKILAKGATQMLEELGSAPDNSILSHSVIHRQEPFQEGPYKPEASPSLFSQERHEGHGPASGNKDKPSSCNIFGQNTEQNIFGKPMFSKDPNKNNDRLFGEKK